MRWEIYRLPIACFLLNIFAKNYQNPTTPARVTAKNVGGVFLRHSVYGGYRLRVHLCMLFNMFVRCGYVPDLFMKSVIIPLVSSEM